MPKSSTLLARVSAVLERHVRRGDRLLVGLSGGIDSAVLLDVLKRAARRGRFGLAAIHVNHQLNPSAPAWAKFCRALCRRHAVPLTVKTVEVPRGDSLEAAARAARYRAYAGTPCDAVVLAHNLDDQAETLLLQLLRGAGVKGVSAMPEYRTGDSGAGVGLNPRSSIRAPAILRPLLETPRSEIAAYARARKLEWVEDDSNADTAFDRNFVRHRLLPVIAERYPAYRRTLLRASRNFAEAAQLADLCAQADARAAGAALDMAALRGLPVLRVKNALRYFLARHGVAMPNARRLEECARQVLQGRPGRGLVLKLDGCELRSHGGELQLVRAAANPPAPPAFVRAWRRERRWRLSELGGTLVMTRRRGQGISMAKLAHGAGLIARTRRGGERLRPDPARPRRTLKNLLQERRVPEWQRDRLPLLFVGDALVYVAGVGVDAAFQAGGGEWGVEPDWQPDVR